MTVTVPPDRASVGDARPPACSLCGSAMRPDQEWCLECGAGRTPIAGAPDWRIPVAVIATVALLVVAGLAYGLSTLSDNAGKVTVISSASHTARAAVHRIGAWPPGADGYTVLLDRAATQTAATNSARRLQRAGIAGVGVLSSSQHSMMKPAGVWFVYAGRYPDLRGSNPSLDAEAAAAKLRARVPHARAALVQKPGGF